MKANEYIKKYGTDCAKEILKHNQDLVNVGFFINLKRLVESYELVENWGGLDDAKFALQLVRYPERLKQAIADVESCMESGK